LYRNKGCRKEEYRYHSDNTHSSAISCRRYCHLACHSSKAVHGSIVISAELSELFLFFGDLLVDNVIALGDQTVYLTGSILASFS
jgi:hypothetical protein